MHQPSLGALICCSSHRLLQVSRHKQCRIRVTVSERPGQVPQKGHKVRKRNHLPSACMSALPRRLRGYSAKQACSPGMSSPP